MLLLGTIILSEVSRAPQGIVLLHYLECQVDTMDLSKVIRLTGHKHYNENNPNLSYVPIPSDREELVVILANVIGKYCFGLVWILILGS